MVWLAGDGWWVETVGFLKCLWRGELRGAEQ